VILSVCPQLGLGKQLSLLLTAHTPECGGDHALGQTIHSQDRVEHLEVKLSQSLSTLVLQLALIGYSVTFRLKPPSPPRAADGAERSCYESRSSGGKNRCSSSVHAPSSTFLTLCP
jgi:hypothetical protein